MEEKILQKLEHHDEQFDAIKHQLQGHDEQFDAIKHQLQGHDEQFDAIKHQLQGHDERFDSQDARMDAMATMILENRELIEEVRLKVDDLPSREYWEKMYALLDKNLEKDTVHDTEFTMLKHGLKRVSDKVEEHDVSINILNVKMGI